jgi:hypothetical protein
MCVWGVEYGMAHFIDARSHLESKEMKYMYSQWRERNVEEAGVVFIKPLYRLLPGVTE